ncbi:MAG: carboxypeptidase regulatory-like domain-containing protein [Rhodospirillales bacterium]|nr:carboxypeptidase regulatory-like domain-containing protein [Rhodospirillales bacterium]
MGVYQWFKNYRHLIGAALIIAAALSLCARKAEAVEQAEVEEWIFEVVMPPNWYITQGLFVYQHEGRYYLPMIELGEAFEFYMDAELDRKYVSGFASKEENTFTLDGERGEMTVKGKRQLLSPDAILSLDDVVTDDLYVQLEVLNELWPVEMHMDLGSLAINVEAEEELSFQRRLKRQEQLDISESRRVLRQSQQKMLPYRENPYLWFGKPVLDIQTNYTFDNDTKEMIGQNLFSGSQQLGKMIADYSANIPYSKEEGFVKPSSIRFRAQRQAFGDDTLFIGGVRRFEAGDISLRQRDLVGNGISGRGVTISNDTSRRESEFDRITVEGVGPPGWEAELYNNNELLEVGAVDEDGEYRFEDVVLNFGNNQIRVVLYGPQGQVREEVKDYQVNGSMLRPGDFRYSVGVNDAYHPLILLEDEQQTQPHGVTKNATAFFGLNRYMTIFGTASALPTQTEYKRYLSTGAVVSTPIGIGEVEAYSELGGGEAVDMGFITKLLGINLNLRSAFFNNFESVKAGFGTGAQKFTSEVQAKTTLKFAKIPPLGLRVDVKHKELYNDTVTRDYNTSQSMSWSGIRLTNTTNTQIVNHRHTSTGGNFSATANIRDWQVRSALNYLIFPEDRLSNGSVEFRYKPKEEPWQAAVSFQHNFQDSISTIGGQLGYDFGNFLTSLESEYQQERGWKFTARASTSINPYQSDQTYHLSSQSQRKASPVMGQVFIDHDDDGVFGGEDEALEDVALLAGNARSKELSDTNGYVLVSGPGEEMVNVQIDKSSLIDPYYVPKNEGFSTVPLPGTMPVFTFPIVESGAIDGTVSYENGNPISGMYLQLVNADGEVVDKVQSAYDGFYSFEFVVPGTYTVRADPEYQVNVPPETVTVASDDLFASGIDLFLLEQAEEAQAADDEDAASGDSGEVAQTHHSEGTLPPASLFPDQEDVDNEENWSE